MFAAFTNILVYKHTSILTLGTKKNGVRLSSGTRGWIQWTKYQTLLLLSMWSGIKCNTDCDCQSLLSNC